MVIDLPVPERLMPHKIDDIKVEYHPNCRRKAVIHHFDDYRCETSSCSIPLEDEPWRPFLCRNDFEFARVAMEAALKPAQVNALILLIHKVALGERFTLPNERGLSKIWRLASQKLTPVCLVSLSEIQILIHYFSLRTRK